MKKQIKHQPAPVVRMHSNRTTFTKETLQRLLGFHYLSDEAAEELGPVVYQLAKILGKHIRQKKAKKE